MNNSNKKTKANLFCHTAKNLDLAKTLSLEKLRRKRIKSHV